MIGEDVLAKIAGEYGTPSYVFDEDEVRERVQKIRSILNDGNTKSPIGICYSIKANPFLIPALADIVDSFEVCSPGELEICKELRVPGKMIIYSGVNKGSADVAEAIRYGAGILTAESIHQYEIIRDAAKKEGALPQVILRLNSKSQFGMSETDIEKILGEYDAASGVKIIGIHYFAGTHRTKLKRQKEELSVIRGLMSKWEDDHGIALPWFEYGPGFAYPYFEGDDFSDTLAPAKELAEDLREVSKEHSLTVEMGRFIASSCGYYLSSIADIKTADDHNWCIIDGGINHVNYLGQMMGLKNPVIKHIAQRAKDGGEAESWTLCGSLCTTADVLVRDQKLSAPSIGDLLIFYNIGAYSVTEGIYLFLGRDMPKVIMYRGGQSVPVRDTINTWKLNFGKEK